MAAEKRELIIKSLDLSKIKCPRCENIIFRRHLLCQGCYNKIIKEDNLKLIKSINSTGDDK